MGLKWFKIAKRQPESMSGHDIDVIVKIEGLSMTASEYDEYRVVKWRPKINCFIEWHKGEVIKYNDKQKPPRAATVTRWAYFNRCEG